MCNKAGLYNYPLDLSPLFSLSPWDQTMVTSSDRATPWVFKCVTLPQWPAIKYIFNSCRYFERKKTHFLRPCPSFLTRPKLISFFVSFRLFFSWLTMAFTRAAVTCNIIVRSRGSLNWISNLIKHLTLDYGPLIPLPRPSGCDGSNMAGDSHESWSASWLLFPMLSCQLSQDTHHTISQAHVTRGSQKIKDSGHEDDTMIIWGTGTWCDVYLEMFLMINSELLGWETPVTACLGALADNGCFQQTGAHCPQTQSRHLGTVEPFHPAWSRSIYHDILLAWKINDEIIFRDLSTLQSSRSRQFRLKIGLSDIAYTLPQEVTTWGQVRLTLTNIAKLCKSIIVLHSTKRTENMACLVVKRYTPHNTITTLSFNEHSRPWKMEAR